MGILNKRRGRGDIKAWLIVVMAALIILPLLKVYFSWLQLKDYYQCWPLLLMAVGILFTLRWRKASPASRYPPRWSMGLIILPTLILLLCVFLYYLPWTMAVVTGLVLAWGAIYLLSYRKVENMWGIWLLCLLCIRPPYQMMLRMMAWMEDVSLETASLVLDYLKVLHSVQGGLLALPEYHFDIQAICSGWVSMVSTVMMAAILAVARNRKCLHSVSLLLSAVGCCWLLNIFRTIVVVGVQIRFDTDLLAEGYLWAYQLGSLLVALVLVGSADAFLVFLLGAITKKDEGSPKKLSYKGSLVTLWRYACEFKLSEVLGRFSSSLRMKPMSSVMTVMVFGGLFAFLVMNALVVYYRPESLGEQAMHGEESLTKIDEGSVVFDRPGWEVIHYELEKRPYSSIWGSYSNIWTLAYHGVSVTMSLDYPFDDWHDIKVCYSNLGWEIEDEKIIDDSLLYQWAASETDMALPNGDSAMLLCSHCDHLGNVVVPKPAEHGWEMILYRIRPERMTPPFSSRVGKGERTFYQAQCKVSTPMPMDEATKEEIRMMYARFRQQARDAIVLMSEKNKIK